MLLERSWGWGLREGFACRSRSPQRGRRLLGRVPSRPAAVRCHSAATSPWPLLDRGLTVGVQPASASEHGAGASRARLGGDAPPLSVWFAAPVRAPKQHAAIPTGRGRGSQHPHPNALLVLPVSLPPLQLPVLKLTDLAAIVVANFPLSQLSGSHRPSSYSGASSCCCGSRCRGSRCRGSRCHVSWGAPRERGQPGRMVPGVQGWWDSSTPGKEFHQQTCKYPSVPRVRAGPHSAGGRAVRGEAVPVPVSISVPVPIPPIVPRCGGRTRAGGSRTWCSGEGVREPLQQPTPVGARWSCSERKDEAGVWGWVPHVSAGQRCLPLPGTGVSPKVPGPTGGSQPLRNAHKAG